MSKAKSQPCLYCGRPGLQTKLVTRSYGKGAALLLIEGIPIHSCPHCGETYLTADTLHEIERIRALRKAVSVVRPVSVATFAQGGLTPACSGLAALAADARRQAAAATRHARMTFHEDGDVVSIWVGSFESRADLDAYLHPFYSPGPDTDELPLSAFAADVGLPWYDEDFLEADRCLVPIGDLAAALEGFSYSSSFAAAVATAVHGAGPFNTFVLLYGYDHSCCPGALDPNRVRFLGTFPYDPNARQVLLP